MMTLPSELRTSRRVLMGPGPSDVNARVLQAMSTPLVGHLDPEFITVMDDVQSMLRQVFQTKNELTFAVSAPGSAGMECCLVNLLEPGDEALICIHGVFGGRMAEIAERAGAQVTRVEADWGRPIDPDDVRAALKNCQPKVIAVVHAETSTGVLQPLDEISAMAQECGALLVVDCVTSLGGCDLRLDEWGVDAAYSGTQKCLSAPPGLSPVSFSARAVEAIEKRQSKVQSWFLDLNLVRGYWGGSKRAYHHTAPVSSCFALREALRIVLDEGLDARFKRHLDNHNLLRDGLAELGLELLVEEGFRLPMLNTVKLRDGIDDANVRRRLLEEYNIEIGAGLGALAGKVWRIGIMGESSTRSHVRLLLAALRDILD